MYYKYSLALDCILISFNRKYLDFTLFFIIFVNKEKSIFIMEKDKIIYLNQEFNSLKEQ